MKFNIIYTNNGPRTPNGGTTRQTVAGLSSINVYMQKVGNAPQAPQIGNSDATSVIQSNGENIGNAQAPYNPLPPGIKS